MSDAQIWTLIVGVLAMPAVVIGLVGAWVKNYLDAKFEVVDARFDTVDVKIDHLDRDVEALTRRVMGDTP